MQFIPGAKIDFSSLREVRNKTKTFSLTRKIVFLYKKYLTRERMRVQRGLQSPYSAVIYSVDQILNSF